MLSWCYDSCSFPLLVCVILPNFTKSCKLSQVLYASGSGTQVSPLFSPLFCVTCLDAPQWDVLQVPAVVEPKLIHVADEVRNCFEVAFITHCLLMKLFCTCCKQTLSMVGIRNWHCMKLLISLMPSPAVAMAGSMKMCSVTNPQKLIDSLTLWACACKIDPRQALCGSQHVHKNQPVGS